MRTFIFLIPLVGVALSALAKDANEWLTRYEQSQFVETSRYEETVTFCQKLADASRFTEYRTFGASAEGRDLPLLWIDQADDADAPLVLIIAGIHSGEIDGKDAGLTLFRDALVLDKHPGLLDNIRVAFVPIFNVDGHERFSAYSRSNQRGPKEMGWRTTAQNINLNRDWLKADTPEMHAMLDLINKLQPDFLMDIHVTDGVDCQYVISYALGVFANELAPIRRFNRDLFLPDVTAKMREAGYEFVPYILPRSSHDIRSGLERDIYPPRFSNGYGSVINRPFILIETHSLKDYRSRVTAVYEYLRFSLMSIGEHRKELLAANRSADSLASSLPGRAYVLNWSLSPDTSWADFAGVSFEFMKSAISGGDVVQWGTTPEFFRIPVFDQHFAADSVDVPCGYVIPAPWLPYLDEALQAHNLPVLKTGRPTVVDVETYRFDKVTFSDRPYEGRFRVNFETSPILQVMSLPAGSALIPLDHPRAQVAIHLLEPKAPDSFVRWGFMTQIFEQKEYMESYVADTLARRMLAESPGVAAEFNARLATDSTFAGSPEARWDFFYQRSSYWDDRKDLYPVGRILSASEYERIKSLTPESSR